VDGTNQPLTAPVDNLATSLLNTAPQINGRNGADSLLAC
jgi:hypothetical protein